MTVGGIPANAGMTEGNQPIPQGPSRCSGHVQNDRLGASRGTATRKNPALMIHFPVYRAKERLLPDWGRRIPCANCR